MQDKRVNIVLLVADAMRSDYVSCYGFPRNTTPNIDRLAREGCRFDQAVSVSSLTPAIFSSLFTGRFPFQHGIKEFSYALNDQTETLAQRLRKATYRTGAITGSVVLDRSRKFSLGFDSYDDKFIEVCLDHDRDLSSVESHSVIFRTADVCDDLAVRWLKSNQKRPFFLFVHFWDTHVPLIPPKIFFSSEMRRYQGKINGSTRTIEKINAGDLKVSRVDLDYIRGLYEAGVMAIDRAVGNIVSALEAEGVYDDTIVLFTSDHGSSLGEHQMIGNGRLLYEKDVRIPLILAGGGAPKFDKKVIPSLVSTVDIMPTLLGLSGYEGETNGLSGRDLTPLMEGRVETVRQATYSETFLPVFFENKRIVLRTEDWKYIREPLVSAETYQPKVSPEFFKTFFHRLYHMKGHRSQVLGQALDRLVLKKRVRMHQRIERRISAFRPGLRELYHIKNDPSENTNLIQEEKGIAREMDEQLKKWVDGHVENQFELPSRDLDDTLVERLQHLGYM